MTTQNTVNDVITDGTNTLTMGGNVAFAGAVTATGTLTFNGNATFGGAVACTGAVTLAGAFTTVGANALTFTTTAATNLTLPTSGTLATTAQIGNLPFAVNTGTTAVQMVSNNRYASNGSARLVYTLPTAGSSANGDVLKIIGAGANGWQIAQNASDQIFIGTASTTAGTGGSVSSGTSEGYDNIEITRIAANVWVESSGYVGNLVVV
jgi:hypothetical protein